MNPIIKEQLDRIRCPISEYDESTTSIHIDRQDKNYSNFEVGSTYMVELAQYILYEPENFSLSSNWNGGIVPTAKFMEITVKNVMGKMIQVDGEGYIDLATKERKLYSDIWLPVGGLTQIN